MLDPLGIALETGAAQLADATKQLGGVSLALAVAFYVQRHPGVIVGRKVPEVVAELLASKRADNLSPRYLRQLEYDFKGFMAKFPGRIGDVTGVAIDDWLRGQGAALRTPNNLRAAIGGLFAFAKGRKYLPKDQDELDALPVAKDNEGAMEIFRPTEMAEMLAVAGPAQVPFLAISGLIGPTSSAMASSSRFGQRRRSRPAGGSCPSWQI